MSMAPVLTTTSPSSTPRAGAPTTTAAQGPDASALPALAGFTSASTPATVDQALKIVQVLSRYYRLPWRVAFTILEHEAGVRGFAHHDGVMQTTRSARDTLLPRIPRRLKLMLLELPPSDATPDAGLARRLEAEFHRRLAVQIAAGHQELKDNFDRFNGYVALALVAYNAGPGWATYMASGGRSRTRPPRLTADQWERMCRFGATLLHQLPADVDVGAGVWQCDKNLDRTGNWFITIAVRDRTTRISLVSYQYLRSVRYSYRPTRPSTPCTAATHARREPGSGTLRQKSSRTGALDKLYDPTLLGPGYRQAVAIQLSKIPVDANPLKVVNGRLTKVPAAR